jgi:hypothetical protein
MSCSSSRKKAVMAEYVVLGQITEAVIVTKKIEMDIMLYNALPIFISISRVLWRSMYNYIGK